MEDEKDDTHEDVIATEALLPNISTVDDVFIKAPAPPISKKD